MDAHAERTEVLVDQKSVTARALAFFSNTKIGLDILTETITPPESDQSEGAKRVVEAYLDIGKRGGRLRLLTNIDEKNVGYCKELPKIIELRHLAEAKGNFALSESEFMSSPSSATFQPGAVVTVIYSNAKFLVEHNRKVFETFWNTALPADVRIREMEEGLAPPTIQIIRDPRQIQNVFLDLVRQAKNEILLILPTANSFLRVKRAGVTEAVQSAASERGVKVSMVAPNSLVQEAIQGLSKTIEGKTGGKMIDHRRIPEARTPIAVIVLAVDRKASLVIEMKDDSEVDFDKAIGDATYSTRNSTVLANVRFFERLWDDVELREHEEVLLEKEKRSRRAAELLQDILSHDIRNYNQIVQTSAEMLSDDLTGAERRTLIDSILKATRGSTDLIERAKKLGKILSQAEVELHPVDVEGALQRSVALVTKAHPERSIHISSSVKSGAQVLADDLLEEAFTNILSNSVNYTERDEVPVEVRMEEMDEDIPDEKRRPYWKITFTDHGKGIPDKVKENIFTRYLTTSTGSGLGLSIVYALVVDRYSGKAFVSDRVEGDHTKGTKVEVWLPRS